MRIDLHLHTDRSDGEFSPAAVVAAAGSGRLNVIAITDHDTVVGVPEAMEAAREVGITVLPGVELSSTYLGREIHVLGYGFDPGSPVIAQHGAMARARRLERMESMVARLTEAGVEVEIAEVTAAAGAGAAMIGRPHLARVLVGRGYAESTSHAFDTLIGDQHLAFVPTDLGTPEDAVATIRRAGGTAVWAHPPMELIDELLPSLVDSGLRGVEIYRPGWPPRRVRQLAGRARTHGLCVTGGSDFHGSERNGALGDFWVRSALVKEFLEEIGVELP